MEDDDMLRASGVSAHIVEAKAAMNADVRVVIKVAPGYHTAEIPAKRGIPEGAHSSPDDSGLQTAGLPAALRAAGCGLMIGGERVASLLHMDDSGIFARDEADLRRELDVGFEWLWRHGHVANGEKLEFAALADHSRAPRTFDYVWLPSEADEPDVKRRAAALQGSRRARATPFYPCLPVEGKLTDLSQPYISSGQPLGLSLKLLL